MRRALAASVVLLAASWPTAAQADPVTSQKAAAQALFDEGRSLVEHGRFAEACPKLAESQRLDPGLGTLLWLADCLENNGQTASAWATFSEAAAVARQAHDRRERVARDRSRRLEGRLARLVVVVPRDAGAQGLVIERDGVAIGSAEWGVAVPVDPGSHTIAASAAGFRRWTTTLQIAARADTVDVKVPPLDPEPSAPPPAVVPEHAAAEPPAAPAPSAPRAPVEAPPPAPAPSGGAQRSIGGALAVVGVVGLGLGTYFSLLAKSTYDGATSSGHCGADNACDPTGKQQRADAFSQATVATVGLGAGAAALAAGAVLYLTAPRAAPVRAAVAPSARGGTAWVTVDW